MTTHTLLLTPWMQPHRIVSWEAAITLLFNDKIEVLEEYDEVVRSPSLEIPIPAVARLMRVVSPNKKGVKFSRINVLTRDKFTCQYCGRPITFGTGTYDHVIPKSQGGKTVWENIVSSCKDCNSRKANRTPEQARMKLRSIPKRPKSLPLTPITATRVHEMWRPYMQA